MGYHEYQKKWDADIGAVLEVKIDIYAVAV